MMSLGSGAAEKSGFGSAASSRASRMRRLTAGFWEFMACVAAERSSRRGSRVAGRRSGAVAAANTACIGTASIAYHGLAPQ